LNADRGFLVIENEKPISQFQISNVLSILMSSESERFIELASRPFENNAELKLAAAAELRR
jgi:hypothetical protein